MRLSSWGCRALYRTPAPSGNKHVRSFLRSFVYALNGLRVAIKEERNMRFHLCMLVYVLLFSLFYSFAVAEYVLLLLLSALVISLELVNSALERAVSRPLPERYVTAGVVKDMAAGAVLVASIAAAVCGVLLFWDTAVFVQIWKYFTARPVLALLLLASLGGSYWFVFWFNRPPHKEKRL